MMKHSFKTRLVWVILFCITLSGSITLAGSTHQGQVKFGGLPLPGASVVATQNDKKVAEVTDEQATCWIPDLADGVWTIEIEMSGFSKIKQDVTVAADAPASAWELKMLPLSEISTVKAAALPAAATPETNGA